MPKHTQIRLSWVGMYCFGAFGPPLGDSHRKNNVDYIAAGNSRTQVNGGLVVLSSGLLNCLNHFGDSATKTNTESISKHND